MQNQQVQNINSTKFVVPTTPIKYVLYARKSTESEEKQILSIDSQINEMKAIAEREGLSIVDIRRESHSAKDSGQRPVFKEILADIQSGRYNGILTWAPDRLSRNAGDLGSLVDLMDQKKLEEIKTYGQNFKNSPNEKFLLMILCSQAKLENDNKSINVKRGLKTRCEMGLWPTVPPTGYVKDKNMDRKCQTLVDQERATVIKKMFEKVAYEKWTGRKIYHWLKFEINFKARSTNKTLTLSNIYLLLQNPFYYGYFEFPRKSGNWYKGSYEPLISKELFDIVQGQIKGNTVSSNWNTKEFAFTKMMICGICNSGITAYEKYKKLKNGETAKYIYYSCTHSKLKENCGNDPIEEKQLIEQFVLLMDKVDLDELSLKSKIKEEVERMKKFQNSILGQKSEKIQVSQVDIKNYAKYILRDGQIFEKRELLECLKTKIVLNSKNLSIASA